MAYIYNIVRTSGGIRTKIRLYPADWYSSYSGVATINDDSILSVSGGSVKFDKAPVKIAEIDERKIVLNLHKLDESDTAFRNHIFEPLGTDIVSPTATTWNIKNCNMWVISDDGGNSGLSENDFIVRFIGAQKDVPEAEGKLSATASEFEISLVSIFRYILEGLEPYHIARQLTGDETGFQTPTTATVGQLWDTAYQDTVPGWVLVWDMGRETTQAWNDTITGNGKRYVFRRYTMFNLMELFEEIRLSLQYVWRTLFNDNSLSVTYPTAPLNNLDFYKQNYNINDNKGTALTSADLNFVGIVEQRNYESGSGGYSAWAERGGYLQTNSGLGAISGYSNCWDLLGDLASNFCAKIIPAFDYTDGELNWLAPRDSRAAADTITTGDFYDGEISWKMGEYRIRGCTAEIVGAGNGINEISDFVEGASENRDEGNVKILFSNLPYSGETWGWGRSDNIVGDNAGTDSFNVKLPENSLYYSITNPSWLVAASTEYIRVHHHVDIDDGITAHTTPSYGTLPEYSNTFSSWEGNIREMWDNFHSYSTVVAKSSGLPFRLCYVNTEMLSGKTMLYEGTGLKTLFPLEKIGDSYSFDVSNISAGLSGLVNSTVWLISVKEKSDLLNDFTILSIGA